MRINDFIMLLPNSVIAVALKTVRAEIDEKGKQEILEHGLYHVTQNEETSKKIIESQHFKPARGIMKNINSYGKACVCFFDGVPSIENYMKNLLNGQNNNPYVNPTIVIDVVKVMPTKKEELANYKVRALEDNAILYEGYCIIPKDEVKSVKLVPDLVRDEKTGEPIINSKTGKYDVFFREATEEELSQDKKSYKAKEDYLQFMEEEKEKFGYLKSHNLIANTYNSIISIIHVGKIEGEMSQKNVITNLPQIIKRKIQQLTTPKLDIPIDEKIQSSIQEFDTSKKNPYRNKRFGEAVAEFQTQGLQQMELKDELEKLTTSDIGKYFRQKYKQINQSPIISKGIHGIDHNNRVAVYSMLIAQNEGILEKDSNNKTKDILLMASYYHSKNSARKLRKMDLEYLNGEKYTLEDRRTLQAIVEAHEGKDKDMRKICQKYKINEEKMDYVMQLMTVLKDADALDRVRLDLNLPIMMQTDLAPQYLRTNTSKRLLNASYQLETLSAKVSFDRILAYKTQEQQEGGTIENKREQFMDYLKKGIPEISKNVQNIRKNLSLYKGRYISKLTGKNISEKGNKKEAVPSDQIEEEEK